MGDEAPEQEAAEPEPSAPDVARLQRELEDTRKRSEDLLTRLQYLQAELENTRKRADREVEQAVRRANEGLLVRLLPVLDDLDAAVVSAKGRAGKGLALLRENVLKALKEFGLEEIPAAGMPFDPYVHECVQQVNDDALPDGQVKEVVRKGYMFQKRVLRPAQVVVTKRELKQPEGEPDA
jgi:molecular chaperone GrpE